MSGNGFVSSGFKASINPRGRESVLNVIKSPTTSGSAGRSGERSGSSSNVGRLVLDDARGGGVGGS